MKFAIKRILLEIRLLLDDIIYFPVRFYKNHFTGWSVQHTFCEFIPKDFYFCPSCYWDFEEDNPKRCPNCGLLLNWEHIEEHVHHAGFD